MNSLAFVLLAFSSCQAGYIGNAGYGYAGLGYAGHGYAGLGYAGQGYAGYGHTVVAGGVYGGNFIKTVSKIILFLKVKLQGLEKMYAYFSSL